MSPPSSPISCVFFLTGKGIERKFVVGMQSCSAPKACPSFEGGAAERGPVTFPMGQHCLRRLSDVGNHETMGRLKGPAAGHKVFK